MWAIFFKRTSHLLRFDRLRRNTVEIIQKLPIQSVHEKGMASQYTAKIVAAKGSADAKRLAFCPPINLTAYK